ncbi:uncharacterized protein LOC112046610 [Bicyclus anynana]|uniref:1-acyl-sn-glycerol-3-phosphate acyltransferase n=1 Tax=Bicyclus anynana TaxID=110368 RepID=A0ABM3M7Y0_BICAN|nr:uncharacterized protein LOC112046610 [Bicyclus anynana]
MWNICIFILFLLALYLIFKYLFKAPDYVTYYAKFGFYLFCVQIIPVLLIPLMLLSPKNLKNGHMVAQILIRVTNVLGISWTFRNEKNLSGKISAVVIGNHQSVLDVLGMCQLSHMAKRVAPVVKKELFYFFPFGLTAYLMGCIFIDRKNPRDAYNTLKDSANELFKNKYKIVMYPEGTRSKSNKMQPFKNGAFAVAIAHQVPIIPIITSPYYFLDSEKRIFGKGQVIIQCLEAISTEGLTMDDLPQLKDSIHKMMEETFEELGKEISATHKYQEDYMCDISLAIFCLLAVLLFWKYVFNMPDYVIYYAKFGFLITCALIVSLVLLPVMLLSPRNLRNGYMAAKAMRHVTKVIGVTWIFRNEKVLSARRSAVVIGNHQSVLDMLGMCQMCEVGKRLAPVCKKELLYWFPVGLVAYLIGCVFIDRKNPKHAYSKLEHSAEEVFKNQYKIGLFPEGTRGNSNKMLPFKNGAFALAIACQVPIIPIVVSPYYFLDYKKRIFKKGKVIVKFLETVPTEGLTMDDLPNLKDSIRKMMEETYEELSKEIAATQKLHEDS